MRNLLPATSCVHHNIILSFNSSFQLSAAQRPKRLSLTVEDPKGEEVEVHVAVKFYFQVKFF